MPMADLMWVLTQNPERIYKKQSVKFVSLDKIIKTVAEEFNGLKPKPEKLHLLQSSLGKK